MKELFEIMLCTEIMEEAYPKLRTLSEEGLSMFLGVLVDQWTADHNLQSEKAFAMVEKLATTQLKVHEELGLPERTV